MDGTKTIEFHQISCGSDCTGPYRVEIQKPMTVRKFINDLLAQYPGEWGHIGIYKKGTTFGSPKCDYEHGRLLNNLPEEYLDKEIEGVTGGGGWSYSTFTLHLKEGSEINNLA